MRGLSWTEKDKINDRWTYQGKSRQRNAEEAAAKDAEIQELKAKLDAGEVTQKLAVTEALKTVEKERDALINKLTQAKLDNETDSKLAKANHSNQLQETSAKKDREIQELKSKLNANEAAQKHAITEAVEYRREGTWPTEKWPWTSKARETARWEVAQG